MAVHISEMKSTVRATDSQALLDPQVLEEVVRRVLERVREERDYERRVAEERRLSASSSPEERFGGCRE